MQKIHYKLFFFAIFIIFSAINTGFVWAAPQCAGYSNTQCGINQQKKDITIIDPVSGNECVAKACADSCPPKSTYFCDPNSSESVPAVEEGSNLIYPAYTCVNYTCIGLEAPLPQVEGTNISSLDTYFKYIYQIGLGIVGIAALIMIVIGGIIYMTSAGNASQKSEAKDRITNAILGLILALSAYLILYTINPDLVKLTKVQLQYPPMPKIIFECDKNDNICKSRVFKKGDDASAIQDTCGIVGASCSSEGTCELTNAYWNKEEAKIGDNIQLIVEAKGLCDEITLNEINIYEKNVGPNISIDAIAGGKTFTRGLRSYTSDIDWTVKETPSDW